MPVAVRPSCVSRIGCGALGISIAVRAGLVTALAAARARAPAWIDDNNYHRRHSALGMMSPVTYEKALQAGKAA